VRESEERERERVKLKKEIEEEQVRWGKWDSEKRRRL
jgi:hypothetical protein